jgi:hypothetical protein
VDATPNTLGTLIGALLAEQTNWKPSPQRFSTAEVMEHLYDVKSQAFRLRLVQMVNEDQPKLEVYDQEAIAIPLSGSQGSARRGPGAAHPCCAHPCPLSQAQGVRASTLARWGRELVPRWGPMRLPGRPGDTFLTDCGKIAFVLPTRTLGRAAAQHVAFAPGKPGGAPLVAPATPVARHDEHDSQRVSLRLRFSCDVVSQG